MAINWNDPVLLVQQYCTLLIRLAYGMRLTTRVVDFIKLQHALGGVYIWELVVGIGYDWKLLRKKQLHAASLWAKWVREASILTVKSKQWLMCLYV